MKTHVANLAYSLLCLTLTACGPEIADVEQNSGDDQPSFTESDKIDVSVKLAEASAGFSLADATDYTITLEGCASGLTGDANSTTNSLRVFKFDTGCLAKLTSFDLGLDTYVPSAASPFSTWLVGNSAIFENSEDASDTLQVTVIAQLSSPVSETDGIEYGFSEVSDGGTTNVAASTVSDSHAIAVSGEEAPNFSVAAVRFVGMKSEGAGEFEFDLECNAAISGAGLAALCGSVAMGDIRYTLIADTFGADLPTSDQIASAIATESRSIAAGEIGAIGSNGGFSTKSKASGAVLEGPDQIAINSEMILILEQNGSATIFQIDVASILTDG